MDPHRIEAMVAITGLKARYCRCLDTKDWVGLAAAFTDDAEVDMTDEGGGVTHGPDAFVTFLRPMIETAITVHQGHMPELALTSDRTATGIWAMEDRIWWPEGGPVRRLQGWGHYHETYERTDDGWRIATMRLSRLHRIVE